MSDKKELTPEEQEMIDKINTRISELHKQDLAIDLCRGKGVTLEKNQGLGEDQREIEKELSQLKTQKIAIKTQPNEQ